MAYSDYQLDMQAHESAILHDHVYGGPFAASPQSAPHHAEVIRYREAYRFRQFIERAGTYTQIPHAIQGEGLAYGWGG